VDSLNQEDAKLSFIEGNKMLGRTISKLTIPTFIALSMLAILQIAVKSENAPQPIDAKPIAPSIQIPCCKCIGGDGSVVSLNTGSGPGTVPYKLTGPGGALTAVPITSSLNSFWTASLPPAGWVQPNNSNGATTHPGGLYTYSVKITVPNCTIPMKTVLSGSAAGDDQIVVKEGSTIIGVTPLVAISLAPAGSGGWGFRAERIVNFTTNLTPGTHTLSIEVNNGDKTPSGVLVNAGIRTICGKSLVIPSSPVPDSETPIK
jgi:hypothetical protein